MTKALSQGKSIQIFQPGKHLYIIISKIRTLYFKGFDNSKLMKQIGISSSHLHFPIQSEQGYKS